MIAVPHPQDAVELLTPDPLKHTPFARQKDSPFDETKQSDEQESTKQHSLVNSDYSSNLLNSAGSSSSSPSLTFEAEESLTYSVPKRHTRIARRRGSSWGGSSCYCCYVLQRGGSPEFREFAIELDEQILLSQLEVLGNVKRELPTPSDKIMLLEFVDNLLRDESTRSPQTLTDPKGGREFCCLDCGCLGFVPFRGFLSSLSDSNLQALAVALRGGRARRRKRLPPPRQNPIPKITRVRHSERTRRETKESDFVTFSPTSSDASTDEGVGSSFELAAALATFARRSGEGGLWICRGGDEAGTFTLKLGRESGICQLGGAGASPSTLSKATPSTSLEEEINVADYPRGAAAFAALGRRLAALATLGHESKDGSSPASTTTTTDSKDEDDDAFWSRLIQMNGGGSWDDDTDKLAEGREPPENSSQSEPPTLPLRPALVDAVLAKTLIDNLRRSPGAGVQVTVAGRRAGRPKVDRSGCRCLLCGTLQTPQWRFMTLFENDPWMDLVCNACYMKFNGSRPHYSRLGGKIPPAVPILSPSKRPPRPSLEEYRLKGPCAFPHLMRRNESKQIQQRIAPSAEVPFGLTTTGTPAPPTCSSSLLEGTTVRTGIPLKTDPDAALTSSLCRAIVAAGVPFQPAESHSSATPCCCACGPLCGSAPALLGGRQHRKREFESSDVGGVGSSGGTGEHPPSGLILGEPVTTLAPVTPNATLNDHRTGVQVKRLRAGVASASASTALPSSVASKEDLGGSGVQALSEGILRRQEDT